MKKPQEPLKVIEEVLDFPQRIPCRDGSCIGTINDEGVCNVCKNPLQQENIKESPVEITKKLPSSEKVIKTHPNLIKTKQRGNIIGFIIAKIIGRTLSFGFGLSAVLIILGAGLKGISIKSSIRIVPYCMGFAFIVTLIESFTKNFWRSK